MEHLIRSAKSTAEKFLPFWRRVYESCTCKVAYDIGAQLGVYGSELKKMGFDVHVFEPSERYRSELEVLFGSNFHPVAVGDRNETVDCELNDCTRRDLNYGIQRVNFVTLDDYSAGLPRPGFIKMDIEGMETVAFKGMKGILGSKPVIQLEYHKSLPYKGKNYPGFVDVESGGFDFESLLDDYVVFDRRMRRVRSVDFHGNFFFIPKGQIIFKSLV